MFGNMVKLCHMVAREKGISYLGALEDLETFHGLGAIGDLVAFGFLGALGYFETFGHISSFQALKAFGNWFHGYL